MTEVPGHEQRRAHPPASDAVEVFHWNPVRPWFNGPLRRLPVTRVANNFGDLLGPEIVARAHDHLRLRSGAARPARLLSVGSVLHFARDGDVVWGSGVNGKVPPEMHDFASLDVRALRGPLTHGFLRDRGVADHEVPYGDPGLLLGVLRPDLLDAPTEFALTIVPNLNDRRGRWRRNVLDPRRPLERCLQRISRSELVVGSSLHGIVVAEALGIPARAVRSPAESEFKYADYYRGTGRPDFSMARSIPEAVAQGGMEPPRWDAEALLAAFPRDLWG